jgi:prophage regulatory protein
VPDSPEIQPDSGDFFMKQHQAPIPVHGLLRLPQVLSIIPISKSAWWEGCRTGRYPKPVKLGPRTTVWRAEDIAAFIKNLGRQGENHENPLQIFRDILTDKGLIPAEIMADGKLHRCPTQTKPHKQNGAYIAHVDIPATLW